MRQLIFLITLILVFSCKSQVEHSPLHLWYKQPAKEWIEALPIGNGRLGAMVFGETVTERIQLNEESLWSGSQINNNNPNSLKNLGQVRKLILDDELDEAIEMARKSMLGTPLRIRSYQTLGDLFLDFGEREITNYKRELDLQTGICKITYSSEGVIFNEEVFASAPDNIIIVHLTASKRDALNLKLRLEREKDAVTIAVGEMLLMSGQVIDEYDPLRGPGGAHMRFEAQLKAINKGGKVFAEGKTLFIENASELFLLFTAATDYNLERLNFDKEINPTLICENILKNVEGKSYNMLKKTHLAEYQALFNRVLLDLGGNDERTALPTDERLQAVKEGADDPQLVTLYFQFGRYLLMGSSRFPGVLPANLQGLWCKDFFAKWSSDYHTNINLQMNYWPAEICNLSETAKPLINFVQQLQIPGALTAKECYGARGWTLHHVTDVFGRTGVMDGIWGLYPVGGPWMTIPLYEHYAFNCDNNYLKDIAYPAMKGSALFVLDYLIKDKQGRWVTAPSSSPENMFIFPGKEKRYDLTYAATMDIQIITELFTNCIKAAKILGTDKDFTDTLANVLNDLPGVIVSERTGGIQEWINDYEEKEPGHRHMSHLFGLYPGTQITPATPELYEAAKKTINRRLENGGGHTGWSRAWIINFFARLGDGENAWFHVMELLRKSTLNNLFNTHPPFQIDGNFGGISGIAEMFLQSHGNQITILPALPNDWCTGSVKGLCARGGFEIDIYWENGKLTKTKIQSLCGNSLKIIYQDKSYECPTKSGEIFIFDENLKKKAE